MLSRQTHADFSAGYIKSVVCSIIIAVGARKFRGVMSRDLTDYQLNFRDIQCVEPTIPVGIA